MAFPPLRHFPEKVKTLYDYRDEFREMDPAVLAAVIRCAQNVWAEKKGRDPRDPGQPETRG